MSLGITALVGNPKAGSRTRLAAEEVARQVGERLGDAAVTTIDLADHTGVLLDWASPVVAGLVERVTKSDLLIAASPTFKATYSGLLKVFLDRFAQDQLAGLPTVPLMVGARPGHALAVEHTLRPVLVEIGASTPTRGLYLLEGELADPAAPVGAWLDLWGGPLVAAVTRRVA